MKSISKIVVSNTEISVIHSNNEYYISLTDMAGYKDNLEARIVVSNWMSTYYTVDFWQFGNKLITRILTVWDSIRLDMEKADCY